MAESGGRGGGGEGSDSMLTIFGSAERRNRHRPICLHFFFKQICLQFLDLQKGVIGTELPRSLELCSGRPHGY